MRSFDAFATAEQVTAGLDLSGKTALVTGVTAGIGLETMRVLALRGARVLAAGRTREKAAAAIASLEGVRKDLITPFGCNQERLADVAAFADEVLALGTPLDIVVANAGVVGKWRRETIEGIEEDLRGQSSRAVRAGEPAFAAHHGDARQPHRDRQLKCPQARARRRH